jgi:hypothetical protein
MFGANDLGDWLSFDSSTMTAERTINVQQMAVEAGFYDRVVQMLSDMCE